MRRLYFSRSGNVSAIRLSVSVLVSAAGLLPAAANSTGATNLIRNPGFEEVTKDPNGTYVPTHWRLSTCRAVQAIELRLDHVTFHGGRRAMRFLRFATPPHVKPFGNLSQRIEVAPGLKACEFSCWVKCKGLGLPKSETGQIVVWCGILDRAGEKLETVALGTKARNLDWKNVSKTFAIPEGAAFFLVSVPWPYHHEEGGRLWIDDFSLTPVTQGEGRRK